MDLSLTWARELQRLRVADLAETTTTPTTTTTTTTAASLASPRGAARRSVSASLASAANTQHLCQFSRANLAIFC